VTAFIMMFDMNLVTPKAAAKHEGFYKSVSSCLTCACLCVCVCVCVCVCLCGLGIYFGKSSEY